MSMKSRLFNLFVKLIKSIGYERTFLHKFRTKVNSSPFNILPMFLNQKEEIKFIDVGANKGQTIDRIVKLYPKSKIYSFEPTPDLITELREKYAQRKNIFIYGYALGDHSGETTFYTCGFSPSNSSLKPDIDLYKKFDSPRICDLENLNEIKVPVKTLNEWYGNENLIGAVDVLKIDTQGTEYNVLKGAIDILSTKIKIVIFEGHFYPFYKDSVPFFKVIELLYENGFYLMDLFGCNYNQNRIQMIECDFVLINNNFFSIETLNKMK